MHRTLGQVTPTAISKLHLAADLMGLWGMCWALGNGELSLVQWAVVAPVMALGWLVTGAALRAYQPEARPTLGSQATLWASQGAVVGAAALLQSGITTGELPESKVLVAAAVGLAVTRAVHTRLGMFFGGQVQQVLIVGVGPLGRTLGSRLERAGTAVVAGYLPLDGETINPAIQSRVVGPAGSLATVLSELAIDTVFVAGSAVTQHARMQEAVTVLEELGMPFALPAHALTLERATPVNLDPKDLGFIHHVASDPRQGARGVKRLFDVLSSGFALVMLAPLLLGVAAIIKLTSRGPVLFKQKRVGMHGRPFNMLKFRSMVVDAEAQKAALAKLNEQEGPVFKMKNDPRVTRIGRFIRRFSIDELPQLVNILRGDMSVVGPRPPVPQEVAQYQGWQRRRLSVRPGLTCHWQVSGRNNITFEQWMLLDLRYIDQWTFFTDLKLIARTIPAVFTGRGAS